MTDPNVPELNFDEALSQLEEVVQQLETGKLTLEESMSAFEKGMKLSTLCNEKLTAAETKIEKLTRQPDGSVAKESLDF